VRLDAEEYHPVRRSRAAFTLESRALVIGQILGPYEVVAKIGDAHIHVLTNWRERLSQRK